MTKQLICLIGPTGVGKTDISIKLAQNLKTEIVSCDSRQMFQEMSIGTAVPDANQLKQAKHHFIQTISIHNYYSVYEYELDALNCLKKLFSTRDTVILTGGSGLYLDALLYGMDDIPDPDPVIRQELEERYHKEGLDSIRFELKNLDPEYYDEVDKRNYKRIIRGLEVCLTTGKTFSYFRQRSQRKRDFNHSIICLDRDRAILHDRINSRTDQMLSDGLINEARGLHHLKHLNALKTVGYRELFEAFDGNTSEETAIELIKRNSRRYARRQITWNKRYKDAVWFDAVKEKDIVSYVMNQSTEG